MTYLEGGRPHAFANTLWVRGRPQGSPPHIHPTPALTMKGDASSAETGEKRGRPQGSPPHVHPTPALTMKGDASDGEAGEAGGRPQGSPPHVHPTPALTMNVEPSAGAFAVGVDGGGSKTLAVVVDVEGNERGRGVAGSSNHTGVGIEQAVQHIYRAVEDAARQAGCVLPLQSAWFGLAGVDHPGDYDLLLPYLRRLAQSVRLTNDAELVLSGLPDAVGIALIAGTGSIALGRDARGTKARAGGWGHIIGDEGSGYDLGCRCLQAVARATDGRGQATLLVEMLLRHWRLDDASDMIGKVYNDADKATIAALSALVFAAARDGDEVACGMVEDAARELALVTVAVKNKLDFAGGQVALALGGGLLLHETDFRTKVISAIDACMSSGDVALVEEPALSGARVAIRLLPPAPFGFDGDQLPIAYRPGQESDRLPIAPRPGEEGDRTPSPTHSGYEGDRKGPRPTPHPPPPLQ